MFCDSAFTPIKECFFRAIDEIFYPENLMLAVFVEGMRRNVATVYR